MQRYCARFGQLMDRKRVETALMVAKDNAEQAAEAALSASRAKTEFLANMSHEIRTPMNGVLGMTDLLSRTELTERQQKLVNTAHQSAETLLHIINDILDFSKIDAGKLALDCVDFEVRKTVGDVLDLLAGSAQKKNVELAYVFSRDVPRWVGGDSGRLRQVMLNLVGNAIKFTDSGEVVVRAEVKSKTDDFTVLCFEISDTGVGIPSDIKNQILQPFEQADRSITRRFGGTGLGLSIAVRLIEMMGGTLTIESEPDKGSKFRFTVAMSVPRTPLDQELDKPFKVAGARALIVDDNATNREILHYYLSDWNITSVAAGHGQQALQLLRAAPDQNQGFDIVLLDMMMPGMSGLEVAEAIRNDPTLAPLPLIFLTSMGRPWDLAAAQNLSDVVCLTKPVRQSELHDQIGLLLSVAAEGGEQAAPSAVATGSIGAESRPGLNAKILLAEDNPVNQEVADAYLQDLGCRVDIVATGLEALSALERNAYDIVVMDCQMPDMDGLEATRRLREREQEQPQKRRTPVIAVTANAYISERERCLAAGMDDYLSKPYDQDDLEAVLRRWLSAESGATSTSRKDQTSGSEVEISLIDREVLQKYRCLQKPGGPSPLEKIITSYLKSSPKLVQALRDAIAERNDMETTRQIAHSLKASNANVGATKLVELCVKLEETANEIDRAEAEAVLYEFEKTYALVCKELVAECDITAG